MYIAAILPTIAGLTNILISNDDGWAELNIRSLYKVINEAGYNVLVSAPAVNKSGRGSLDAEPTQLDSDGCEFASCPPFSPATGFNKTDPALNYVNSYPVTSVKYGITETAPRLFNAPPDLVLTGPNVGNNLGIVVLGSGTVGAACEAVKQGIPAIALSGYSGSQISWQSIDPGYSKLYADLSMILVNSIVAAGQPYLPSNVWLNVNFLETMDSQCNSVDDFSFVLTRIAPVLPIITDKDIEICGNDGRLPTERSVIHSAGCYASISVGFADSKHTADAEHQQVVYDKLRHILTCLPGPTQMIDL